MTPALAPWDPFVLFTVSWGRVAMLGKLAFEDNSRLALPAVFYP